MENVEKNTKSALDKWIWGLYCAVSVTIGLMVIRDMGQLYGQYNERQMEVIAGLLAEKVNNSIEHIVDNAKQAAMIMGSNEDMDGKEMYREMQGYVDSTSFISMGMVDRAGTFYGKSGEWRDMDKYQYIQKAMEGTETYITEPYRSSVTATHVITVFQPIYQEGRKCIIYASFPLERIQEFAQTEALEVQPEIALLNAASGNYIACTDGNMAAAGSWNNLMLMQSRMKFAEDTAHNSYMQSLQNREASGIVRFTLEKREYIQGYVQITGMPDWYIAVNISTRNLSDFLVRYQTRIAGYVMVFVVITVLVGVWIIGRQMTQKKRLQKLSEVDSLTGIMNKRAFIAGFREYVQKYQDKALGTLIFVDIDDFKRYNDTYGHLAGDVVLKSFADTLQRLFGEKGLVGRYGGDEFVIFCKGSVNKEETERRLRLAQEEFKAIEIPGAGKVKVTFSSGIACFRRDGNTYEELCDSADKALYCVKEKGKDGFAWYK